MPGLMTDLGLKKDTSCCEYHAAGGSREVRCMNPSRMQKADIESAGLSGWPQSVGISPVAESVENEQKPFDPLTQVSADAKYIVKNLVLWFFVLPLLIGILAFGLYATYR
jgi:hypothetical protein